MGSVHLSAFPPLSCAREAERHRARRRRHAPLRAGDLVAAGQPQQRHSIERGRRPPGVDVACRPPRQQRRRPSTERRWRRARVDLPRGLGLVAHGLFLTRRWADGRRRPGNRRVDCGRWAADGRELADGRRAGGLAAVATRAGGVAAIDRLEEKQLEGAGAGFGMSRSTPRAPGGREAALVAPGAGIRRGHVARRAARRRVRRRRSCMPFVGAAGNKLRRQRSGRVVGGQESAASTTVPFCCRGGHFVRARRTRLWVDVSTYVVIPSSRMHHPARSCLAAHFVGGSSSRRCAWRLQARSFGRQPVRIWGRGCQTLCLPAAMKRFGASQRRTAPSGGRP